MEYIHKDFNLAHVLKYGIAFHHGSLPLFIRKKNRGLIFQKENKFLSFCTSTLLEGVNLPTKNVFIYPFPKKTVNDEKKMPIRFFGIWRGELEDTEVN